MERAEGPDKEALREMKGIGKGQRGELLTHINEIIIVMVNAIPARLHP